MGKKIAQGGEKSRLPRHPDSVQGTDSPLYGMVPWHGCPVPPPTPGASTRCRDVPFDCWGKEQRPPLASRLSSTAGMCQSWLSVTRLRCCALPTSASCACRHTQPTGRHDRHRRDTNAWWCHSPTRRSTSGRTRPGQRDCGMASRRPRLMSHVCLFTRLRRPPTPGEAPCPHRSCPSHELCV